MVASALVISGWTKTRPVPTDEVALWFVTQTYEPPQEVLAILASLGAVSRPASLASHSPDTLGRVRCDARNDVRVQVRREDRGAVTEPLVMARPLVPPP